MLSNSGVIICVLLCICLGEIERRIIVYMYSYVLMYEFKYIHFYVMWVFMMIGLYSPWFSLNKSEIWCLCFLHYQLFWFFGQENDGGFLKLKRTSEWLLGDVDSVPMNKKMALKVAYLTALTFIVWYTCKTRKLAILVLVKIIILTLSYAAAADDDDDDRNQQTTVRKGRDWIFSDTKLYELWNSSCHVLRLRLY